MQEIELGLIVGVVLAILATTTYRFRQALSGRPLLIGGILGVVPGVLGAVVILVPRTDLIPDAAEPTIWLVIALGTGAAVIAALSIRLARR